MFTAPSPNEFWTGLLTPMAWRWGSTAVSIGLIMDGRVTTRRRGTETVSSIACDRTACRFRTPCNQYRHWDPKTSTVSR
jgi:hypothetical protein